MPQVPVRTDIADDFVPDSYDVVTVVAMHGASFIIPNQVFQTWYKKNSIIYWDKKFTFQINDNIDKCNLCQFYLNLQDILKQHKLPYITSWCDHIVYRIATKI